MLNGCDFDEELVSALWDCCGRLSSNGGVTLSVAHNDLGSGTDCEQRIFDLKAERVVRESEKAFHEKKRLESSKQKDFAVSAKMRRAATEGKEVAVARIAEIDEALQLLEQRRASAPWYVLFSPLAAQNKNVIRRLDLSNCGLHATGLVLLTDAMLELEHRAEGERISQLALDGNDLGDIAMTSLAGLLRLSSSMQSLQLRNVSLTDVGISQILSALVRNKTLCSLDLRDNGLCSMQVCKAALEGVRRFNTTAEVLLE